MAEGGLNERLMDPPTRARIKADMKPFLDDRMGDDPSRIQFSQLRMDPEMAGKRLSDLLAKHNKPLNQDAAAEMLIEIVLNGGGSGIYHSYSEEDMQALLRSPFGMVGSDGAITAPGRGFTHPRAYGAFARVLGRYVRELGVISLEAAIRKMTSFPAARLNLKDRGLIREGMAADIVVFDPATIADRSDFMDPHQYAVGVEVVVVNGVVAIEEGEYNEAKPGRALHGPGRAR
jgi:N-acyl-D-aspartate/D-glutamate deacylase